MFHVLSCSLKCRSWHLYTLENCGLASTNLIGSVCMHWSFLPAFPLGLALSRFCCVPSTEGHVFLLSLPLLSELYLTCGMLRLIGSYLLLLHTKGVRGLGPLLLPFFKWLHGSVGGKLTLLWGRRKQSRLFGLNSR
jgi:hypothetical protein